MRNLSVLIGMTIALAACDPAAPTTDAPGDAPGAAEGFTLQVLADEADRIYLVEHTDGRSAAARVSGGVSTFLDSGDAQGLLADGRSAMGDAAGQEVVSLRVPGFSLSIKGDADSAETGGGERATIDIGVAGKQIAIDADGVDGGGQERAVVRVAGADAAEAREFITHADELDPGVQQQMLDALGL